VTATPTLFGSGRLQGAAPTGRRLGVATTKWVHRLPSRMGLGHLFGLGDAAPRALCTDCGRPVTLDPTSEEPDACPDCGSGDLERVALL